MLFHAIFARFAPPCRVKNAKKINLLRQIVAVVSFRKR